MDTLHSLIQLQSQDGARATLSLKGGQVCSWVTASGYDALYMSPQADWSEDAAIRGGIPVVFPQFSNEGPMIKHGFARISQWQLVEQDHLTDGRNRAVLTLHDNEATRAIWPHSFMLILVITLGGETLDIEWRVANVGSEAFIFTAALHNYFNTDIFQTQVTGVEGKRFLDAANHRQTGQAAASPLTFDGETDCFFFDATVPAVLHQPGHRLTVERTGFTDVVVWNPWAELSAKIVDLPDDAYRHYVCIEPAVIEKPVSLAPGVQWKSSQRLTHHTE